MPELITSAAPAASVAPGPAEPQNGLRTWLIFGTGLGIAVQGDNLDVAIARFREFQALRDELKKTKDTLADRKLIDRAKAILMRERGLTEEAAHAALQRLAMDRQQRLGEVAEALIAFAGVLKKK